MFHSELDSEPGIHLKTPRLAVWPLCSKIVVLLNKIVFRDSGTHFRVPQLAVWPL